MVSQAIRIKSRVTGAAGAPSSLKTGELAINHTDEKMYVGLGNDGEGNATAIKAIASTAALEGGEYLTQDAADLLYEELGHTHPASEISDGTSAGRALLTAADASAQRTALGLAAVAASGSATDLTAGTLPAARFDDTAHGTRSGGTLHAEASSEAAGFLSASDKSKLDGIATGANAYTHPNHSGDVTSVGDGATTIAANAVTNAKLADMAAGTYKMRVTASTGDPEDATPEQATAGLVAMVGDSGSGGTKGLAPAPAAGDAAAGKFLKADGTWATPSGGGDLLASNNLSDVANAATAFGNIKQSASDSATGVVELATTSEASTGTDTSRAVTPAGIDEYYRDRMAGVVFWFAGASAPTGSLLCDGSAVSRTTYSRLFAAIGTAHGSGDGSTTFNLPDIEGRFIRGRDNAAGRDPDAASRTAGAAGGNTGDAVGSVQDDEFESHNHEVYANGTSNTSVGGAAARLTALTSSSSFSNSTSGATGGSTETRPKNIYLLPCIFY